MKYDRILLLIVSIAAIALSVLMVLKVLGFSDKFVQETVAPNNEIEDPGSGRVDQVREQLGKTEGWTPKLVNGYKVPLNKSIPIITKTGSEQLYNPHLAEPKLRPPMTNEYLIQNELLLQYPDVGSRDPDEDGFSNLEEFAGGTSPKSAESHPPFTNKLFVVERIEVPFELGFAGSVEPFQVTLYLQPRRKSSFVNIGEKFGKNDRFEIKGYTQKYEEVTGKGRVDVSELEIFDSLWNEPVVLVHKVKKNIPTYFANFEFRLGSAEQFQVKKEDTFKLPNDENTSYKLVDISESQALVSRIGNDGVPGAEIPIPYVPQNSQSPPVDPVPAQEGGDETAGDPSLEPAPAEGIE